MIDQGRVRVDKVGKSHRHYVIESASTGPTNGVGSTTQDVIAEIMEATS